MKYIVGDLDERLVQQLAVESWKHLINLLISIQSRKTSLRTAILILM